MKTLRDRRTGISLIEILVAIAIVALLLTITMSVVGMAKQRAIDTQCLSNLRQTAQALLGSAVERDNQIVSGYGGNGMGSDAIWGARLVKQGYLADKNALRCPVGKSDSTLLQPSWSWHTYGININGEAGKVETSPQLGYREFTLNLEDVARPSEYLLVADSASGAGHEYSQVFRIDRRLPTGVHARHNGKVHAAFVDAHVAAVPRGQMEELLLELRIPVYSEN